MSWSIEEHIGENRPWPGQITVYRGETSECLAYVSGEIADMLIAENVKLRELVLFANKTVEGLCEMVENSPGCFMCPLNQDEDRACGAAELCDRMTQLGVEAES